MPSGTGRPPLDPAKRALWDKARAARQGAATEPMPVKGKVIRPKRKPKATEEKPSKVERPVVRKGRLPRDSRLVKANPLHNQSLSDILGLMQGNGLVSIDLGGIRITRVLAAASTETNVHPAAVPRATPATVADPLAREMLADVEETQKLIDDPLAFEQDMIDAHIRAPGKDADAEDHAREARAHIQ